MEFDDEEEEQHFREVLVSFKELPTLFELEFVRKENGVKLSGNRLSKYPETNQYVKDFTSLINFENRFRLMRECNLKNKIVLDAIVMEYESNHIRSFYQNRKKQQNNTIINTTRQNLLKVKSTLHQFVREWSEEGKQERERTFQPILNEIETHFASFNNNNNKKSIKICIPGCGLSRLVIEIAALGSNITKT